MQAAGADHNKQQGCRVRRQAVSKDGAKLALFVAFGDGDDCRLSRPPAARVSGVVEESPGSLSYEVALYRDTSSTGGGVGGDLMSNEVPVDQAVPIGTKLQLRASIGTNSGTYAQKHEKQDIGSSRKMTLPLPSP